MRKKKVKAFITIEFALLIPVILLFYTVLIYVVLYWYNQCILQTNMYLLCMESIKEQDSEQKLIFIKDKQHQLYNEKYIFISELETEFCIRKKELSVTASGTMSNLLEGTGLLHKAWKLQAQSSIKTTSPAQTLHLCKEGIKFLHNIVPEEKEDG